MSKNLNKFIVKDYSVSGEEFELKYNQELELLETFPQPSEENLASYYNSEDYISHTDSKRNLFEKAYHLVRKYALNQKLKLINSLVFDSKNLLDVGCGTGDFLYTALQDNWTVSGIEPNLEARNIANNKTNNSVFKIEQLNKFSPHSFDVITLWHVFEHLPKLDAHINVFKKLLTQNGKLIIAVPNYKSYDAVHYKTFWAAYDVPRHLWHFSQDSIKNLFNKVDMEILNVHPMKFDAFYVSLLSEKHKNGKLNFFKSFWIGFKSNLKAKRTKEYSSLIYVLKNT